MQHRILSPIPGPKAERIDILKLLQVFRKRFPIFLSTLLLVTTLVTLYTLQVKPVYTASANVLINPRGAGPIDLDAVIIGAGRDSSAIDTEVEVLLSRTLARKVVRSRNLMADPEFNASTHLQNPDPALGTVLMSLLPENYKVGDMADAEYNVEDIVISNVLENLEVERVNNTYVLELQFSSHSPAKSAMIVNTFAENYLLEQLETKFEATSRTNDWLNVRLGELRNEVRVSENAVEIYRADSGLLSVQGSSLTEQQIADLNAQKVIEQAAYNEVSARLDSVKSQIARGVPADTIAEVMASGIIRDLRRQESEIASRLAELSTRYGPRHPDVMEVERETSELKTRIDREISRIVSNLESEAGIARQKVQTLEQNLVLLRRELTTNNRSLVRLRELEREAEASRTLYQNFLEQFKQIDDQEEITQADARIISRAVIPTQQSYPRSLLNIILGSILGVFLGIGMVVLSEMLDQGLSTGEDVERETGMSFLASVPDISGNIFIKIWRFVSGKQAPEPSVYMEKQPFSLFTESFRMLRSSILFSGTEKPPKVVAITSALPNEGKTTLVKSMGKISTMSGSRTLIIDCDLRLQSLSKTPPSPVKGGLVQYLKGKITLKEAIVIDEDTGCHYLLNTKHGVISEDHFGSAEFDKMLNYLRKKYDMIILDTAPVLLVAETQMLAKRADCVVMAARWRRTRVTAVNMAVSALTKINANLIGLVLTKVNFNKRAKYGVGDYSYYAKQYGKYYNPPTPEPVKTE